MKHYTYLVAGGGIAAARAIEGIREVDRKGSILLVCRERHLPYDRPPLSKAALSSAIGVKEIAVHTPWFYLGKRCRVRRGVSLVSVDLQGDRRRARLSDGGTISFDRGILATGARPRRLSLADSDLAGLQTLRTIDDAQQIRATLLAGGGKPKRVVIIGAGFIGLEAAASIASLGTEVTLLERAGSPWPAVAPEVVASFLQEYLVGLGVRLEFGAEVTGVRGDHHVEEVLLASGARVPADLVLVAVGVVPNQEVAEEAGLSCGDGIIADETLRTSDPAIWVAGDVASVPDPYGSGRRRFEHYGTAEATGYLAGKNAAGADEAFTMLPYVWSDVGEHRVDIVGNERLREETVLRGKPETGRFFLLCLNEGRLVSFFSVNGSGPDRSALQLLIKERLDLSRLVQALEDESVSLQQLVQQALGG
ncbi:MAG: NAD(P)/FAD-dependent oxidoreductase [Alkalispirochaetaceae bacterium]